MLCYLDGQEDSVNRLIRGISRVTYWVQGLGLLEIFPYLLSPPDPPSNDLVSPFFV